MNNGAGEYLCVGDHICLYSVETEGYAYSYQTSSAHNSLYIYHNQDKDKPNKIPNPQAVVFQVCIQNRYKLNKKYRKWLSVANAASSQEAGNEKGLLYQAKLAAQAENADNAAEQKRQLGKRVRYGEIIQLKHGLTKKYIHMCTSQTSQRDKNNMMIMLQEFNAKNAQFRILPQYKVKSEGEVVQIYDQIVFESIKSPGHYFHASQSFHIDHYTFGSEVNLGVERSGFTLVRFAKENPELTHFVRGGALIRLFHKELEAYLVAEGLFDEEVTEDVHFRIRVMDQHRPRTLSPSTSGNTYWQIEAESGILIGDVIRWEQQVRLRHLTTRKYLCIDATREISLTDDNEDPRTVFRLHSVLSERDEIRFESYARIEHVLTGFWLHALKDEDYIRKQFRCADSEQGMRGVRWDGAQVRQVAASGESMYDDAFTIHMVEMENEDEFNFVAGMVPFLLNLIKDRNDGHLLNSKKTHAVLTAMEELRLFMLVAGTTDKNRQKLMRNLRVIDLLVKLLQCKLDGVADEANLIQVFKEAYEILYTYMIGKSRKNALYFAKYIEFFQTQFTQKGGIGLNVAQMIVELIRDKRKIVDRITHAQIDEFVGLLQKNQNYRFLDLLQVLCVCDEIAIPNNQTYIVQRWLQKDRGRLAAGTPREQRKGVFLTARGQDINRQPNILYISTDSGCSWVALHEFVDENSAIYNKDKHDFLIHQLDLYKALCFGRNDYAINIITKELRYLTWEETFLSLRSDILPDAIRAKYCDLTTSLFVDVGNNYSVLDHPNICFIYDYVGSKDEEKSQGDFVVKELVAIFPVLRDWIAEFLQGNKCMYASDIGLNMLIEQVLRLLYHLVKFGYYLDKDDVLQLLPPLLKLLDGRGDYPFYKDKEKGYSKDALKLVQQYQSIDRFERSPETEAIVNAKYQALEVLDLLLTYQRNSRLQSFVGKFKVAEQQTTMKKSCNVLVPLLYENYDPHEISKKAMKKQKQVVKELREMFNNSSIFEIEFLTKILMDLANYKYNKTITKSLNILNKLYSSKSNMFKLSMKVQVLLTQDSARVHREVLKNMPILRRLARAKLDAQQVKLMGSILDDLAEFCHLPMTPDEPHPMNQNILISNGILEILFDVLCQDIDTKLLQEQYGGMKEVFRKTLYLLKLLAKENNAVQTHIFDRLDVLLDVRVAESDLAIALKEVFAGNQTTCLKIHPRQIQKIVNRAADLQEKAPQFLDLLSMIVKVFGTGLTLKRNQAYVMKYIMQNYKKVAFVLDLSRDNREKILMNPSMMETLRYYISLLDLLAACAEGENMFIESLCQTILPFDDLLWILNNQRIDNCLKKPFLRCLHHVYMKNSVAVVETGIGELPHDTDLWEYLSNVSVDMNRLTDSIKEDPDKIAIHLKTAPEKSGAASAPDFESSAYGTVLYILEGVMPFLTTFYKHFYFPDNDAFGNEVDDTDHLAKAVVMFCEVIGPLLYKPEHMKNMVACITSVVPASNMPNSNMEGIVERFASGITVEDVSSAIRRGNIEYYSGEVELNAKFRTFAKNANLVFCGHNTVTAQLKINSKREYTDIGGNEELPLGEEFNSHVKCFMNLQDKKVEKRFEPASILIEQLHISAKETRLNEVKRKEMDELNIKCLQVLRALIHNEERKLCEDWEIRTGESKVIKQLKIIAALQRFYDRCGAMNKCLPHLASRNDDIAKEVLGFLCIMLFNANQTVQGGTLSDESFQHSMLEYFLSTREEVFFMAVRDRMQLSINSIKEKRSLQAQQKARQQEAADTFGFPSSDYSFTVSKLAIKQIKAYEDALREQRLSGWLMHNLTPSGNENWTRKKFPPPTSKSKKTSPKVKKVKTQKKVTKGKTKKELQANGLKKEVTFANPMMKEEEALMIDINETEPEVSIKIECEEMEPDQSTSEQPDNSLEYKNDGYIELVLKVMARMCDGQNQQLQNYLREQPDNVKSFDIIAEVTRFLDVVYSNINGKSIDLVVQLFDSINEFTASNQENRVVIYDNKVIDYINFILRAGDFANCSTEKVLELRQSIANLIVSLVEENGPGASQVAKEVKDTLDKKAVFQLMTECYEMHQPDKTKLEDLKNLSGSGNAIQTAKSFALAGGSFIQGVIPKAKDPLADTYMDVGFSFYLILARMHDIDPKIISTLHITPQQQKAFNFYKKNCSSIEIVKDDCLQKINFRVRNKRVLREEVKEKLKWNVDRSSPSNKIRDLMEWAKDIMKDIAYQRRILSNPVALLLTKGWLFWNHMVTVLSFAINIMMLVTWNAKASLQKGNSTLTSEIYKAVPDITTLTQEQYTIAIYVMGGMHNFFSMLVLISYFVCNHPSLPNPKNVITFFKKLSVKKKKQDEEEDKKKKHVSKLECKFFSVVTFFYLMFVTLSIGGTVSHGYFFAFHLLNIVNNNQLLSGVIKAVTLNGKSLVWVGVLGMVVFYLYGIIGFALMRSMFDPDEYLYCASLWQCTVTVVRYGLIGDLFEKIKAHKEEASFTKFGLVVLFHVSFFIFITTIGLNIIFGIIVDTFSELRDLKWTAESDMRDTCFICSRNSYDFEHHGKGFEHHVTQEHNMWAYIFFFIHLNGTKVNDYNALEMYVFRLLQKENYDFFPLDRALSLASMGKDATETKLDDLLDQVTSIVEKQRKEETEKKRREERMRQKLWEQKHRLGSFRRKAKLPVPRESDPLMQIQGIQGMQGGQYGGMEDPRYMTMGHLNAARRFSDHQVGGGGGGVPPPLSGSGCGSPHTRQDRPGYHYGSGLPQGPPYQMSPVRDQQEPGSPRHYRGYSPSRFDSDEPSVRNLSPVRYDDRIRSPSRSRHGSDPELLGFSPIHTRRQSRDSNYIRQMSPKWTDSRGASPRTSAIFFPDSDSTPSLNMRDQGPPERAMPTVDLVTDPLIDLPPYVMGHDIPTREREPDTDSVDYK